MTSPAGRLDLELQNRTLFYREVGVNVDFTPNSGKIAITGFEVVDPRRRGQGLGRTVMTEICAWADQHGYTLAVSLKARRGVDATRLRRLLTQLGFTPSEEPRRACRTRHALVRFPSKPINAAGGETS